MTINPRSQHDDEKTLFLNYLDEVIETYINQLHQLRAEEKDGAGDDVFFKQDELTQIQEDLKNDLISLDEARKKAEAVMRRVY